MYYKELEFKLGVGYDEQYLRQKISDRVQTDDFEFEIINKSLDARNKKKINWCISVAVFSNYIKGSSVPEIKSLNIPKITRNKKVCVVGSGPAGFFSAYILAQAGFQVKILEQGCNVSQRLCDINNFEQTGVMKDNSNYAFGEGGAGTFSDGKLTSRTKNISLEKKYILDLFVKAGAPKEILYLKYPHIGSDNLVKIIPKLREKFENIGGEICFNSKVIDIKLKDKKVTALLTENKEYEVDYVIFANGHSSYNTFRMLHDKGVLFRTKPSAIGVRVEHSQKQINVAQWGVPFLKGLNSAEYRLTYQSSTGLPVYSFCMCPGGKIISAAPLQGLNIVNGVSNYERNSGYANSAIVVGFDFNKLLGRELSVIDALDWLENLERKAFVIGNNYSAPFNLIKDFINDKVATDISKTTYSFPCIPYDFSELFPEKIIFALKEGLINFSRKIKGFEQGVMLGLETKTSSMIQALREDDRRCVGMDNLYLVGEGSGYSGGIISSAVDGIKTSLNIAEKN
jgi:uncharacterized protein